MQIPLTAASARRWWVVGLAGIFSLAWFMNPAYEMAGFSMFPSDVVDAGASGVEPLYEERFASSDLDEFVHSPSVTALPAGDLMAVWFAGSREGAADVDIRASKYLASEGYWQPETVVATRAQTRIAIGKPIRKLGNPVIALAPDQRLWLFYVSVSVGGWAGSAINVMVSEDLGETWSTPRQLITTPVANISTLVRTAPVFHTDGSIGLPVYHEFLGKFPEYLYMDADARVVDKFRIADGTNSLQPTVVPLDSERAVALLRYSGKGHVLATMTEDRGRTWREEWQLTPWNPNSSLAAVRSHRGSVLVAQNNLIDGRFQLSLDEVTNGLKTWSAVSSVDASPDPLGQPYSRVEYEPLMLAKFMRSSGKAKQGLADGYMKLLDRRVCHSDMCEFQYEYPFMIRATDGRYHLVYAWNNSFIKHVTFNAAWLEERTQ